MNFRSAALALTLLLFSSLPLVPAAQEPSTAGSAGLKIILLKPLVRFEDVRGFGTEGRAAGAEYQQILLSAAKNAAGPKGIVFEIEKLDPSVGDVCSKLVSLTSRLARGNLNDEAMADLSELAALDDQYAVLVQFLQIKTGPGKSWNSMTGAITSSAASTLIQAAVIGSKGGKVIWKGERLVRNKALSASSSDFNKSLSLVYRDFAIN